MSEVRMTWTGLQEFRAALEAMPAALQAEAQDALAGLGDQTKAAMIAAYPEKSGRLRSGLTVTPLADANAAGVRITNLAPDAAIFEVGSRGKVRHTRTGASRGILKPGNVFRPTMARARRQIAPLLYALLEREGLEPSGDEDALV